MKKKLQREGVFKEMKQRRAYEKPSEKKARLLNESTRRCKKLLRKKLEIEGYWFSPLIIFSTIFFASEKSIIVLSLKNNSLSTPA